MRRFSRLHNAAFSGGLIVVPGRDEVWAPSVSAVSHPRRSQSRIPRRGVSGGSSMPPQGLRTLCVCLAHRRPFPRPVGMGLADPAHVAADPAWPDHEPILAGLTQRGRARRVLALDPIQRGARLVDCCAASRRCPPAPSCRRAGIRSPRRTRCSLMAIPSGPLRNRLASVALRISSGSRRRSSPPSSSILKFESYQAAWSSL
jgi:hypothetical protein